MELSGARAWTGWLVVLWLLGVTAAAADRPSEAELDEAQASLVRYLYNRQHTASGGWFKPYDQSPALDDPKHDGGLAALAVLALLSAGESPQAHEGLARGIAYLERMQDDHLDAAAGTYPIGVRAQVWAKLPDRYLPRLETDLKRLGRGAGVGGLFSYLLDEPPTDEADYNHSTTQYGAVGLAAAASRGLDVPEKLWSRLAKHFLKTQHRDGGWSYSATKPPSVSMTCAGIKVLQTVQRELRRGRARPDGELQGAIDRAMAYLDGHYIPRESNRGGLGAYGYAIQRVGEATGVTEFGGSDWYADHANRILDSAARPSSVATAAYDLMFLARGRTPPVLGKLKLGADGAWNRRPVDVYYAAEALAETFEREVRWAVVDPATDAAEAAPPLLFWSMQAVPELDVGQATWLRGYLQAGGLLILNPERNPQRATAALQRLAEKLDPAWTVEPVDTDHPVMTLWRAVPKPETLRVLRVHNGVRDLVLMPQRDWGLAWQRGDALDANARDAKGRTAARGLANLYLHATEHGTAMPGRSEAAADKADKADKAVSIRHIDGASPAEPDLWEHVARRSQIETEPAVDPGVGLLHVTGGEPAEVLPEVLAHARAGGVVLVEDPGGRGGVAAAFEPMLAEALGSQGQLLHGTDPLLAGVPIAYRRYTQRQISRPDAARLIAFDLEADGGGRIVLSPEDLSLAAAGIHQWGLNGYAPDTARSILRNLLRHPSED